MYNCKIRRGTEGATAFLYRPPAPDIGGAGLRLARVDIAFPLRGRWPEGPDEVGIRLLLQRNLIPQRIAGSQPHYTFETSFYKQLFSRIKRVIQIVEVVTV